MNHSEVKDPPDIVDPRIRELKLYAWIGEDELGSGVVGIKQGRVSAGMIPIVATSLDKVNSGSLIYQMSVQGRTYGKKISLARFVFDGIELEVGKNEVG